MARVTLITGELRDWVKFNECGIISFKGKMYKDMHGIFLDGEVREILPASIKSITYHTDYILLRTYGWNLKLEFSQERRL